MRAANTTKEYIILTLLLLGFYNHAFAVTIFVRQGSTGDGDSWATAYGNLQSALNVAVSNDQIWVAAGTYKPTSPYDLTIPGNRDFHFRMKNNVGIYGGFPASGNPVWTDRDPNTYQTILSGDIGTDGNSFDNCYHVFYHPEEILLNITAVLDGFTITSGNADSVELWHFSGGGMFNEYCSPTVMNCTFTGNNSLYGGGMNNFYSNPTVAGCTFSNNSASSSGGYDSFGGGMYNEYCHPTVIGCDFTNNTSMYGGGMDNYYSNPHVYNCTFNSNSAEYGGGMDNFSSSPYVTDCTFNNNTAIGDPNSAGGGMSNFLEADSNVIGNATVKNCVFTGNSAIYGGGMENEFRNPTLMDCTFTNNTSHDGGAMYNYYSSPTVRKCAFNGNTSFFGGGMSNEDSNSIVINCIFSGNAAEYGGGMKNFSNSNTTVINSTFSGNTADFGGGINNNVSSPTINNSIVWGNTATVNGDDIYNETSAPVIAYCNIKGGLPIGSIDGSGNIVADPLFMQSPNDGGDGWGNINDDFGNLKLQGGSPCIDAADNTSVPVDVTTDTDAQSRFVDDATVEDTGNGTAPIVDMGAYESSDPCLGRDSADVDCNGIVNMTDFVYFASRWLQ